MLVNCLKQGWVCCKPHKGISDSIRPTSALMVHSYPASRVIFQNRESLHVIWLLKTLQNCPCMKSRIQTSPWPRTFACTSFCNPFLSRCPCSGVVDMLLSLLFLKHTKPLAASRTFPGLHCPRSSDIPWVTSQLKADSGTQDAVCDHLIPCSWPLPLPYLMEKWMDFLWTLGFMVH